ncbi:hypothetical protein CEXT_697041 [Caerostris extrusa]|uniref:Uncharacterized protein n=1 Tax=Caerostris extrusa TaxID=172846 RepID=A0AAV4Y769_CAEEX|nr:hypothetical protein CEXT_697041 [Caerostris extrusa]
MEKWKCIIHPKQWRISIKKILFPVAGRFIDGAGVPIPFLSSASHPLTYRRKSALTFHAPLNYRPCLPCENARTTLFLTIQSNLTRALHVPRHGGPSPPQLKATVYIIGVKTKCSHLLQQVSERCYYRGRRPINNSSEKRKPLLGYLNRGNKLELETRERTEFFCHQQSP